MFGEQLTPVASPWLLANQPVALELPDLTPALNALQAYLGQRERAALEAAGAAPRTPEASSAPPAAPGSAPAQEASQ